MDLVLVMFKSDGERRDFPIKAQRTMIGRARTADLRVPLSSVSRRHCEILIRNDDVLVHDLGSRNGTFLNNRRIEEEMLEAGDELTIGPVVFTVMIGDDPGEIKPVRSIVEISPQNDTTPVLDGADTDPAVENIEGLAADN